MIASDRTGDGERRRGPIADGSPALKNLKSRQERREEARRAVAEKVPTPAARKSSGGGGRPDVGGELATAFRGDGDGTASTKRQHRKGGETIDRSAVGAFRRGGVAPGCSGVTTGRDGGWTGDLGVSAWRCRARLFGRDHWARRRIRQRRPGVGVGLTPTYQSLERAARRWADSRSGRLGVEESRLAVPARPRARRRIRQRRPGQRRWGWRRLIGRTEGRRIGGRVGDTLVRSGGGDGECLKKGVRRRACWRQNRRSRLLKAIAAVALQTGHGGGAARRARWRRFRLSAAAVLQVGHGGVAPKRPLLSSSLPRIPSSGNPGHLSWGGHIKRISFFIHQKLYRDTLFSLPYIGERKRRIALRAIP